MNIEAILWPELTAELRAAHDDRRADERVARPGGAFLAPLPELSECVVLTGSAAMAAHGIDIEPGDIDIFADHGLYLALRDRPEWEETWPREGDPPMLVWDRHAPKACVWSQWDDHHLHGDIIGAAFRTRVTAEFSGWPTMDLALLRTWKALINRPKDREHVELIDAHFRDAGRLVRCRVNQGPEAVLARVGLEPIGPRDD